jgi:hypothetical protein
MTKKIMATIMPRVSRAMIVIVFVSADLRRQLTRDENKLKLSRESVEVIEYAITRRQHSLEQAKREEERASKD